MQSEHVADGVTLEGDASGRLPVRVAWVVGAPGLEATATDGAVVFVVGDVVQAIRASDGQVLWVLDPWRSGDPWLEQHGPGASGGVVIGLADDGAVLRVFGPVGVRHRAGPQYWPRAAKWSSGRRRPSREPIRPASARSVLHLSHRSIDHRHDRRPATGRRAGFSAPRRLADVHRAASPRGQRTHRDRRGQRPRCRAPIRAVSGQATGGSCRFIPMSSSDGSLQHVAVVVEHHADERRGGRRVGHAVHGLGDLPQRLAALHRPRRQRRCRCHRRSRGEWARPARSAPAPPRLAWLAIDVARHLGSGASGPQAAVAVDHPAATAVERDDGHAVRRELVGRREGQLSPAVHVAPLRGGTRLWYGFTGLRSGWRISKCRCGTDVSALPLSPM